jgi:hypothetical protein
MVVTSIIDPVVLCIRRFKFKFLHGIGVELGKVLSIISWSAKLRKKGAMKGRRVS